MTTSSTITDVSVATIQGQLPAPVIFGDWIMKHREFAVIRMRAASGQEGWAFTLTRDGAVAEQIRKTMARVYVGTDIAERTRTYRTAWRRSLASHCGGVGLRALSIVDLAAWDLAAKLADRSIAEFVGGSARPMPATAIIGYPPATIDAQMIGRQVRELADAGWNRFKAPIAPPSKSSAARLRAARQAAPGAWLGCDAAWMFDEVDKAAEFARSIYDVKLGWFEDVFPPGDAVQLAELRRKVDTRLPWATNREGPTIPRRSSLPMPSMWCGST